MWTLWGFESMVTTVGLIFRSTYWWRTEELLLYFGSWEPFEFSDFLADFALSVLSSMLSQAILNAFLLLLPMPTSFENVPCSHLILQPVCLRACNFIYWHIDNRIMMPVFLSSLDTSRCQRLFYHVCVDGALCHHWGIIVRSSIAGELRNFISRAHCDVSK